MSPQAEAVIAQLRALSREEQAEVLQQALAEHEVPLDFTPEQLAELDRRVAEIDAGRAVLLDGEASMREAHEALAARRNQRVVS